MNDKQCYYSHNKYWLCPNSQRKEKCSLNEHPCSHSKYNISGEIYCEVKKEKENE